MTAISDVAFHDGTRLVQVGSRRQVLCASVLKPLLCWVADDSADWDDLARAAVVSSDNEATTTLWQRHGAESVLARIAVRTGVHWEPGSPETFGRVRISAAELVMAYVVMAAEDSARSRQVLDLMTQVPDKATFGLRSVLTGAWGKPVAVKCGWDWHQDEADLRTLGVAVAGQRVVAIAHTIPGHARLRKAWDRDLAGGDVLDLHSAMVGLGMAETAARVVSPAPRLPRQATEERLPAHLVSAFAHS